MDKPDLNALRAFVAVVRAKGFSAAARKLGIPRSTVSLKIRSLETSLGVRLFKRSTRVISLTSEGEALNDLAAASLDTLERALSGIGVVAGELKGPIRITAPADFPVSPIADAIEAFRRRHPKVTFEVVLTNAVLDLVAENIDIAVRIGTDSPQDMVQRPVAVSEYGLFASPAYMAAHEGVEELHQIEDFIAPPRKLRAYLEKEVFGGNMPPSHIIETDNYALARALAERGCGVAVLPSELVEGELRSGALVQVLSHGFSGTMTMKVAFPTRADISPRVRAFADLLADFLGTAFRK
jgi:DNA-binding transcriptional LysR family regulator